MAAPNYDWLEFITPVQKKFLRDNYANFYDDYLVYGYSVVAYDYARQMDEIYDALQSCRIVENIKLPSGLKESIEGFTEVQMLANNLRYIVTPVEDYHITVVTNDARVVSEARKSLKDIYVNSVTYVSDALLKRDNTAVILDDIGDKIDEDVLLSMEVNSLPYVRRSTIGWVEPPINVNAENILKKFVERYRPCKLLR